MKKVQNAAPWSWVGWERIGPNPPWTAEMAYEQDVARLRHGPVEDPALRFGVRRQDAAGALAA